MIAIVDYKAGNLTSVRLALEALGVAGQITDQPEIILAADRVIFPGVGAAGAAMANLTALGLAPVIREVVTRGTPFLGICVGYQILLDHSEEDGGVDCLGIISGQVKRFRPQNPLCKIPQIGWNAVAHRRPHPILAGIEDETEFYFVHSYYPSPDDRALALGETEYADATFAAAAARDNLVATQFHPERSGRPGLRLLGNFCKWDGRL